MKAIKLFFNGEQFNICDNLRNLIQNSLDLCAPGKCMVKAVTISNIDVEIQISRQCVDYYEVEDGFISLTDAAIFAGGLNTESKTKISLGAHPYADYVNYHLHVSEIVDGYNKIMKRNNKLIEMTVKSTPEDVTYSLKFKN